jgi:hypothetical protein
MNMNPAQLVQQFNQFKQQFQQQNPGVNPQDYIQQLMNQGKVSQQQFEQARSFAGMFGFKL